MLVLAFSHAYTPEKLALLLFLDTQVSPAPTQYPCQSVGWQVDHTFECRSVGKSVNKEVATITKEVATVTKEVDTITKEVATITKLF